MNDKRRQSHLQALPVVLVGGVPAGYILPMDPAQEVQLHSVLGHPVLELVKELTAAGQTQTALIQLQKHSWQDF